MDLSFVNNLFLGRQELDFFKDSVKNQGYVKALQQIIRDYGIVKLETIDPGFNYLRVVQGTGISLLSINAGFAIDKNIDLIDVKTNLIDELIVPGDSITRYVIINYAQNTEEEGTLDIDANGTITGTLTKFTERLRGLPDFPARISFPNSVGNTGEYIVQSVTDDLNIQLNIAAGIMAPEVGLTYKVVGTFTPGIPIPIGDKFPFKNDGYEIRLDLSPTLITDEEFLLAEVVSDGIATTILDRRLEAIFGLNPAQSEAPSTSNALVGVELVQAENKFSARDTSRIKIGWGFKAITGNWTYNSATNQITITTGNGGIFGATTDHTPGDFDGWRVFFKGTGGIVRVATSTNSGSNIVLQLEPTGAIPLSSDISVVPRATQIEVMISNALNPNSNKRYLFDALMGDGFCSVFASTTPAQADVYVQYRHINGDKSTNFDDINDGDYLNESSFNDVGTQTASNLSSVTAAVVSLVGHVDNFFEKKAWIDRLNTFAAMQQFNQGDQIVYAPADNTITMNNTGNLFEMVLNKQDAYWLTTKPEGTFAFLTLTAGSQSSARFHLVGGIGVAPGFSRFTFAAPDPGVSYQQYSAQDVLMLLHTGGRWKLIGSMTSANAYNQIVAANANIAAHESAWTDAPLVLTNVFQNDQATGVGADVPLNGALGTQAPQAGSYLRYKVIGKTCHVKFHLIDIITTQYAAANAASIKIVDVLPANRDEFYCAVHVYCASHSATMTGQQAGRMYAGGNDLIISAQALETSNTSFNRQYTFAPTPDLSVQVTPSVNLNMRYTISGTFTYELT